jgi:Peptidase family M28/PA domain/PDZ domain
MMRFPRRHPAAMLLALGLALSVGLLVRANDRTNDQSGNSASESQQRLLDDVKYLASDELEGRGVGSNGIELAAEHIRRAFAQAGLKVDAVNRGAFQQFAISTGAVLGPLNTLEITGPDGTRLTLTHARDFSAQSFGAAGAFFGELVFCGYGIDAKRAKFDEYEGIDLKGKVALIMRRSPRQTDAHKSPEEGNANLASQGDLRSKVSNAYAHGAAAILFVNDPYTARKDQEQGAADALMAFGYAGHDVMRAIPIMHLSRQSCDQLLGRALKKSLDDLEAAIDADLKPQSALLTGWTAGGVATIERTQAKTSNVIAVLEGEGALAEETLVIGAHYDHVGRGGQGSLAPGSNEIHNGADDNASGTACLIELARRLGARQENKEPRPRRQVVFIAFSGEEIGLKGSERYTQEPVYPLDKTVAMLNLDMVGRMQEDTLTVFGTGSSPIWNEYLDRLAKTHRLKMVYKTEGLGPSDHASFYAKRIPALHFFSGNHADYHRPSDDWDKINPAGMQQIVGVVEELATELAYAAERPEFREAPGSATLTDRGGSRPYFGSIPSFASDQPGYTLSGVSPGGPAEMGGLKAGDRIIQVGSHKIENLDDFDLALRKFSAGEAVAVIIMRGKEKLTFKVTLGKPRG